MSFDPENISLAEQRTRESRARLIATLGQVQQRLRPSTLAQDAVESAAHGVATVARKGADAVRARPLAVAAVAGAFGLFAARGWIADIVRSRAKRNETVAAPKGLKAKRTPIANKETGR